ncbi:MAG: hypothetical protein J1F35_02220 [Erysipelotrichales bacterium]|nr:hypothetical protein [Erysipelotrichales bacterium]
MKIEKLKVYGAMAILALSLSSKGATITVHAEGEGTEEYSVDAATTTTSTTTTNEEVLFEDTDDSDYTDALEDITDEEYAEWAGSTTDTTTTTPESETTGQTTSDEVIVVEDEDGNVIIAEEDQIYNTGRTDIPDYVQTEWERKIGKPEKPEKSENPENPKNPENPEETTVTTEESSIVVMDVPKTGNTIENACLVGGGLGIVYTLVSVIGTTVYMCKTVDTQPTRVISSRRKFGKKSKKRGR